MRKRLSNKYKEQARQFRGLRKIFVRSASKEGSILDRGNNLIFTLLCGTLEELSEKLARESAKVERK